MGTPVTWEYRVSNSGNRELSNIVVTDSATSVYFSNTLGDLELLQNDYDDCTDTTLEPQFDRYGDTDSGIAVTCLQTSLAANASMTCTASGTITEGQYENFGDVVGEFAGLKYYDIDPSHYLGINHSIELLKEISIDGGNSYLDANDAGSAPTTVAPSDALYRITVTNTGSVELENVVVDDDTIVSAALPYTVGNLGVGASFVIDSGVVPELLVTGRCLGSGEFVNIASVSANPVGFSEIPLNDSDPAVLICFGFDVAIPVNQPLALLMLILGMSTMAAFVIRRTS